MIEFHALEMVAPIRAQALSEAVRQCIEGMIFSAKIAPGEKLNEVHIAHHLGVSRGPVREAVRSLEATGWLVAKAQRGSFVRQVSVGEALDAFELRIELSSLIGRRAAKHAEDREIEKADSLIAEMEEANVAADSPRMFSLSYQFHEAILLMTRNDALRKAYLETFLLHRLFRIGILSREGHLNNAQVPVNRIAISGRRSFLAALHSRDPSKCGRAFEDYSRASKARAFESLCQSDESMRAV